MMAVLHPTHTLRVTIQDPLSPLPSAYAPGFQAGPTHAHKYAKAGKVGSDEVLAAVTKAMQDAGITAVISYEKYEQRS